MGLIFIFLLISCTGEVFSNSDSALVIPVRVESYPDITCQSILQRNLQRQRSSHNLASSSNNGDDGVAEAGLIITPYQPVCRADRPELFEPRQCSQYDCFCVNITSGTVLLGTRSSPSDVGDCSTAMYSLFLAIRVPTPQSRIDAPSTANEKFAAMHGENVILAPEEDLALRARILNSLESILKSTFGYQHVTNITQFVSVSGQKTSDSINNDILFYGAHFISIGHRSSDAPLNLIQHRLDEGYLPNVGNIDPDLSRITLIKTGIDDPFSVVFSEHSASSMKKNDSSNNTTPSISEWKDAPLVGKTMNIRSSDPIALPSHSTDQRVELKSHQLDTDDNVHLSGGFVASPFEYGLSAIHQTWQARSSGSNTLRQPGVIAGIVGCVVVVFLLLILFILFCIYRLRKKDEGSYALDEPKKAPSMIAYQHAPTREFYA